MGPRTLLTLWEDAAEAPAAHRAPVLAAGRAGPDDAVGALDRALLALRRETFGPRLEAVVDCAACGEPLEFELDTSEFELAGEPAAEPVELRHDGYALVLRPPAGADLAALAERGGEGGARFLLRRCLLSARRRGRPVAADALPDAVARAAGERLAEADPQAALQLSYRCPDCDADGAALVDPAALLWAELQQWAHGALDDVAELAAAFGWTEDVVLALAPRRRRRYLERVRAS